MRAILLAILLAILSTPAGAAVYYAGAFRSQPILYACNNGVDDDGDGATDYASDPGCASSVDPSELNLGIECDNGLDDDGDGLIDYKTSGGDAECSSRTDTQEAGSPPAAACNDTLDNDGDGATDYPSDTGCTALTDTNELNLGVQCDDGVDNDGDTFIDYKTSGGDPQCSSSSDNTEAAATTPACSDSTDNDGDTFTDYPADPGCGSANDIYEFGSNECDDNVDNDVDTFTDYPDDTDCDDPSDLTEATDIPTPLCADGLDNDSDGLIDYPADAGCESLSDVTETELSLVCDNGSDDDGDGTADFRTSGGDPGCTSLTDTSETLGTECDDGIDNDGDGDIDYPDDANCDDAADNTEAAAVPSPITAAFTASYMQGVSSCIAPCVIHLDATATTDPSTASPFRDLVYDWDCGAGATGVWSTDGKPRRYMKGPITGCLLQTDGANTITLTVTNPTTGDTDTETANITVTAITSAFSGANIHCFSNDTDHTGCPSGGTQHSNVTTTASAWSSCPAATQKRACLFKRGDTFTGNGVAMTNGTAGTIGIIGAYGTGADPVIAGSTSGFTPGQNWVLTGLDVAQTAGAAINPMGTDRDRFTAVLMDFTGYPGACYSTSTGGGSRLNTLEALVEVNCIRGSGGTGTMVFHRGNQFLGLGGTWNNGYYAGTEYVYRTVGTAHSAYQHIKMLGGGELSPGDWRNSMQFRAWAQASGSGPPPEKMNYVVVSDNIIECPQTLCVKIYQNNDGSPEPGTGTTGSGTPQEVSDFIFERNFFHMSADGGSGFFSSGVIHGHGGRMTVRNNVADLQGITGGPASGARFASWQYSRTNCFLCLDSDNVVAGNTVYYDEDINVPFDFCVETGADLYPNVCEHNLLVRPNDATVGSVDVGSSSGDDWKVGTWTGNGGLRTGTRPFAYTPPDQGLSYADDFILAAGSAAVNYGTPIMKLGRDFCHATRPSGASHDAGAWEYGALCDNPDTLVGINSEKMLSTEEFIMFADAIDNSAQIRVVEDPTGPTYESFTRSYTSVGGTLSGTAIPANNEGWPSVDLPTSGTNLVARIDVMQAGTGAQPYPTGSYTLRFDGTGTVQVTGDGTVTCTGTDASCPVTITPSSTGTSIWITSSDPGDLGDPITNVDLLLPGYTSASQFYEPSIRRISPFAFMRTLNAARTNDYECSNLAAGNQDDVTCTHTWGGRTTETGIQASRRGISWERLIDFANAAGIGLWVTIPHAADDTYVTNLATMLRDDLVGPVWMELSNEVWNSEFTQEQYFTAVGDAAGWGGGANSQRRAYVERAADVADIFDSIFTGGNAARLTKVIGSAIGTGDTAALITALASATYNPTSAAFDGMALNPYYTGSGASVTAMLDAAEAYIDPYLSGLLATEFSAIDAAGMDMLAYEGGPLITGSDATSVAASDDERMVAINEAFFDMWFDAGGSTTGAGFICRDLQNGGVMRYPTQPLNDAPKYRGYLRAVNGHTQ